MRPAIVVDVGNTRIKWGRCSEAQPSLPVTHFASLAPDDPGAWQTQCAAWKCPSPTAWAVSGVHPRRRDRLVRWIQERGDTVAVIDRWDQLGLNVRVEHPEDVGIDRLLNAVAVNGRRSPNLPAIIVDAGTAVTVDWVDETGAFGGGAILPGLRLMAQALHEHTALLPLVKSGQPQPPMPGTSTIKAIDAGIFWSVAGGITALANRLAEGSRAAPQMYLSGGDALLLQPALDPAAILWPHMTLDGIRLAAEHLP
jgi:type III pantothenate kinase